VPKISGFKDEFTGKVITNSFQVGMLDPDEISRDWTPIESEDKAPVTPVIFLVGTLLYGDDGNELHVPPEGGLTAVQSLYHMTQVTDTPVTVRQDTPLSLRQANIDQQKT
jgi:hypothetical protein